MNVFVSLNSNTIKIQIVI